MHILASTTFPRRWMTIPEISESTGIRYKAIYKVVLRAFALHSSWVKHEPYPSPDGPVRWLLDTEHELFRLHLQRWQQRRQREVARDAAEDGAFDPFDESYEDGGNQAAQPYMVLKFEPPRFDITQSWPEFCHALGQQGLIVYQNAVALQEGWQWSWRQESGSGYADVTAAVIGALQHFFTVCEPLPPDTDDFAETEEACEEVDSSEAQEDAGARLSLLRRVFRWR